MPHEHNSAACPAAFNGAIIPVRFKLSIHDYMPGKMFLSCVLLLTADYCVVIVVNKCMFQIQVKAPAMLFSLVDNKLVSNVYYLLVLSTYTSVL